MIAGFTFIGVGVNIAMIVGRSNLVRDSINGGQKRYSAEKPSICKPPEAPECENSGASKFRYF